MTPASTDELCTTLASDIRRWLQKYRNEKVSKFMGVGLTEELANLCPQLPVLLWTKLDIVPFIFSLELDSTRDQSTLSVDEQAAHIATKTVE